MRYIFAVTFVFTLCIYDAYSQRPSYDGIYTREIYDQSPIRATLDDSSVSNIDKRLAARNHLRDKKIEAINDYIRKHLQCKIDLFNAGREKEKEKIANTGWLETTGNVVGALGEIIGGKRTEKLANRTLDFLFGGRKALSPDSIPEKEALDC